MSDEIREDTLVDEAFDIEDTLENETQTNDGAVETPSLIFGKYKDMEAAEKGLKELQKKLHQQASEVAQLREKAELKEVLGQLAQTKQEPDDSAERLNAMLKEIADDYREDPDTAVQKQAQLFNAWIADEGRKISTSTSKEISELKTTIAQLQDRLGDMNPDYLEHKDTVDSLVADGMPKAKAIEWAKKLAPKESRVLPTSINGNVRRGDTPKGTYLTKEEREILKKAEGLSDEDLDLMEAEAQDRIRRGGKLI